jgi:hypothetical protein
MSFLDRLFGRSGPKREAPVGDAHAFYYFVRCDKCGEVIRVRLDRRSSFEQQFSESGGDDVVGFRVRKEVMGSGNCFKMMSLEIGFDRGYHEAKKTVRGGTFVTKAEYDQSKASAQLT